MTSCSFSFATFYHHFELISCFFCFILRPHRLFIYKYTKHFHFDGVCVSFFCRCCCCEYFPSQWHSQCSVLREIAHTKAQSARQIHFRKSHDLMCRCDRPNLNTSVVFFVSSFLALDVISNTTQRVDHLVGPSSHFIIITIIYDSLYIHSFSHFI